MPSECKKCGSKENYNFALNIGLCNPCIGPRIEELEEELDDIIQCRKCSAKTELPQDLIGCRSKERIEELEVELTNEKSISAKAYTACGNYQERINELEEQNRNLNLQLDEWKNKAIKLHCDIDNLKNSKE